MFAVIRTGGKQYRVREGDRIVVERLSSSEGDSITFDDVLVIGDDGRTVVGSPTIAGATVTGTVEEQFRGEKVSVYTYKNKTRSRTHRGHRQYQTRVAITGITG